MFHQSTRAARRLPPLAPPHPLPATPASARKALSSSPPRPGLCDTAPRPTGAAGPPRTIVSGIQATGIPHLGNYLGALKAWVRLQETAGPADTLFFAIADLHALTRPGWRGGDGMLLMRWKREMLAALVAVGLDPEKSVLFCQSDVFGHERLMWILSCVASMGYLERMTQWKSKAAAAGEDQKAKLKLGLFSYPVLQAADILLYRATHVPVGEDQAQHLEFARECVTKFQQAFDKSRERPIFRYPETILSSAKRIKSLTDPTVKMSKSDANPMSRIVITECPAGIHRKIMGAVTDSQNLVTWDPVKRPGVANLLNILFHFLPPDSEVPSVEELGRKYEKGGMGLGEFKKIVVERVEKGLRPIRVKYAKVMSQRDGKYLDQVVMKGRRQAMQRAKETMQLVGVETGTGWKTWNGRVRMGRDSYSNVPDGFWDGESE